METNKQDQKNNENIQESQQDQKDLTPKKQEENKEEYEFLEEKKEDKIISDTTKIDQNNDQQNIKENQKQEKVQIDSEKLEQEVQIKSEEIEINKKNELIKQEEEKNKEEQNKVEKQELNIQEEENKVQEQEQKINKQDIEEEKKEIQQKQFEQEKQKEIVQQEQKIEQDLLKQKEHDAQIIEQEMNKQLQEEQPQQNQQQDQKIEQQEHDAQIKDQEMNKQLQEEQLQQNQQQEQSSEEINKELAQENNQDVEITEEKLPEEPRKYTCKERIEEGTKQKDRGNQFVKEKNYEEAIKEYQIAISIAHPSFFQNSDKEDVLAMMILVNQCLNNIGLCQMQLNQYIEAIQNLGEILASDPSNIKANYRLALCYKKIQNYTYAYKFITNTYQCVKAQNQQVWNDLVKELEEIKNLYLQEKAEHDKQSSEMFKKMINNEAQEKEKLQKIEEKISEQIDKPLVPINFSLALVPTLAASTILTKYILKFDIQDYKGILANGILGGTTLLGLQTQNSGIRYIYLGIAGLMTALLALRNIIKK